MKNGFWIGSGVIFVALMIVYFIFVSGGRDEVQKINKKKDKSIKMLKGLQESALSGDLPTTNSMNDINKSLENINKSIHSLDDKIINSQNKFHYVKGDVNWKYSTLNAVQYKTWYEKRKSKIIETLKDSNFKFNDNLGGKEQSNYEELGFKKWSDETSSEDKVLTAHQKLIVIEETVNSLSKAFKDKNIVQPIVKRISFSDFMDKKAGSRLATSRIQLSIEAPYTYINKILSELESNSLFRFEIINQKIKKKKNAKAYSNYPNVIMDITYKFSIFINKKKLK